MKRILKFVIFFIFISITGCVVLADEDIPSVSSKAVIATEQGSGIVLFGKNIDEKIYPASTTKIMTAILAIENLDLGENLVVSKKAISIPWDSSSIYLKEGEILTVEELLYGLLLNSGNDAANVLAEAVSNNIQSFVNLMNEKAIDIGCTNTHFNNTHGYSDNNHYTTASDMAKIFNYCLQNETFIKIISTKSYIINETNKTKEKRYLTNTNRLLQTKTENIYGRYYEYCIGGKTGFTNEAGRCLISFSKKDDKVVIVGIFGAPSKGSLDARYTDAINVYNYAFDNYTKETICSKNDISFDYINMEKGLKYVLTLKDDIQIMKNSKTSNYSLTYTVNLSDDFLHTFDEDFEKKDEVVGNIYFKLILNEDEQYYFSKKLYLDHSEKISTPFNFLNLFFIILIIISILVIIVCILILKELFKKKKRKLKKNP